jgi:hypothetical protein
VSAQQAASVNEGKHARIVWLLGMSPLGQRAKGLGWIRRWTREVPSVLRGWRQAHAGESPARMARMERLQAVAGQSSLDEGLRSEAPDQRSMLVIVAEERPGVGNVDVVAALVAAGNEMLGKIQAGHEGVVATVDVVVLLRCLHGFRPRSASQQAHCNPPWLHAQMTMCAWAA